MSIPVSPVLTLACHRIASSVGAYGFCSLLCCAPDPDGSYSYEAAAVPAGLSLPKSRWEPTHE